MLTESQKRRMQKLANIIPEEKIGDKYYLYHATVTKPDLSILHSFRAGISAKRSVGMAASQGSGFYVFTSKKDAIDRTKSSKFVSAKGTGLGADSESDQYLGFDKTRDGYSLIITLEVDSMDPTKFDVDSELSAKIIVELILKNLSSMQEKVFDDGKHKFKIGVNPIRADMMYVWDLNQTPEPTKRNFMFKITPTQEYDSGDADNLGLVLNAMQNSDKEFFHSLEKQMFDNASAIKYVGEEILKPHKLEIIDENNQLIDVTTNDPK